jgi:hypothetical protein
MYFVNITDFFMGLYFDTGNISVPDIACSWSSANSNFHPPQISWLVPHHMVDCTLIQGAEGDPVWTGFLQRTKRTFRHTWQLREVR